MAEHFYVKFGDLHRFLRYRAETDRQTDRQTPVKILPPRLPSAWVITTAAAAIKGALHSMNKNFIQNA